MKEFRIGEPGGRETRQTQCQEAFQSSCMANTGQHFNSSFFCDGSIWWSVLEKLHRSLHCQTHLKTRPFTVGWVVLGKGHELKKKKTWQFCSKRSPTCILPVCTSVQCLLKKEGQETLRSKAIFHPVKMNGRLRVARNGDVSSKAAF